jgi:hypothetical protein
LFQINGETAIFDTAGLVMSAQHRLKAIGEGTIAVPLLSVYGIDPAAFSTLDQGARRHGSDVLSLLGKEDGTFLSSALTWATRYAGDGIDRGCWYSLPNEEIPSIAEAYPTMSQSVAWAKSKKKTKLVPPASSPSCTTPSWSATLSPRPISSRRLSTGSAYRSSLGNTASAAV